MGIWRCGGAQEPAGEKQYPVFKESNLEGAMKVAGTGAVEGRAAVAKGDFEGAKMQFLHVREELGPTITFWRHLRKDDAIKMLRATLSTLDELDTALSVTAPDGPKVKTLVDRMDASCASCHAVYREQQPGGKGYALKGGIIK